MISEYLFQDQTIGIKEHRIDFLRNEFNYDNIEYQDITCITIRKGLARRWTILLSLGFFLIFLAFLMTLNVYRNSSPDEFWTNLLLFWKGSKGSGLIAMIFLIAFGLYCIILSLMKRILLIIETGEKKKEFEIDRIFKEKKLEPLVAFLRTRVRELIIDEKINVA